ncbi:TPA: hypothetical protein ACN98B_003908, partial [Acinetobacter baumannii]
FNYFSENIDSFKNDYVIDMVKRIFFVGNENALNSLLNQSNQSKVLYPYLFSVNFAMQNYTQIISDPIRSGAYSTNLANNELAVNIVVGDLIKYFKSQLSI